MSESGSSALLKVVNVDKSFPGVHALAGVDFELRAGEVHALLGQNGAGKSTLINILSGAIHPDSGGMEVRATLTTALDPRSARQLGIFTIYQQLALIPQLRVDENIFIGALPGSRGLVDWPTVYQRAESALTELGVTLNPKSLVRDLTVSERQLTEIAKALAQNCKILILDEPTSALTEHETMRLFDIIRGLRARGVGVIYATHKLDEVVRIADRATVLRDGHGVGTVYIADVSMDKLIHMIVGRDIADLFSQHEAIRGKMLLGVEHVSHPTGKFKDVSFELHEGEVLGMTGLMGSGFHDFIRSMSGIDHANAFEIELFNERRKLRSPAEAIQAGVLYLPADRAAEGVILPMSVAQNITLATLRQYATGGLLSLVKEESDSRRLMDKLSISSRSVHTPVRYLSGGNQQKVVIAKALCANAKIFLFDEPTRGIDIGAKAEVYRLIEQLVEKGAGVILASSELPEIVRMADRVLAWRGGRVIQQLSREQLSEAVLTEVIGG